MGLRPLTALLLAVWLPAGASAAQRVERVRQRVQARKPAGKPAAKPPPRAAALADARAELRALVRDHTRRRFRHHWEKAIAGLVRAARGKDARAALLDAAKARYTLYRWSANEADRDEALRLAARATRAGSKEAAALAAAIRREAGDERPARAAVAKASRTAPAPTRSTRPEPAPAASAPGQEPASDEEAAPDPALEAAVGDLDAVAEPLPLGASSGEGPATVTGLRTWSSPEYTRVAIYLSHLVGWQRRELAADGDRPRRLALDLRPAHLEGRALARRVEGARLERVRAAQNDPETVRVVLDLPGADGIQVFRLEDPPRLVLDVGTHPVPAAAAAVAAATESPARGEPEPEPAASATRPAAPDPAPAGEEAPLGAIRRIVVDAGHGGHDPGAIGPTRVREKDVTLRIAQRLARKLRAAGFEVVLTRDGDRFVALEERTAIANTKRGDLFVSIHANAHPRRNRAGIETWFLNVADDRYAKRLAARENGLDGAEGESDTLRILTDLDAKASAGASRRLAQLVQHEVCGGVRGRVGEVRDLGVKSALFYVLLGARMPAVLVETGFISNREEERRLASSRYEEEVAAGVTRAVVGFARPAARIAAR